MSNNTIKNETILFCFGGAIGAGKSTLCEELVKQDRQLVLSVSSTTRLPRPGEIEGEDYYFVSKDEFETLIRDKQVVEYTFFNDNYYGTARQTLDRAIAIGKDVLLDIEIEGIQNLKNIYGSRVVTIFVCPPSFAVWKERIQARGDGEEQLKRRLEIAKKETAVLSQPEFSDYLLVNGDLSLTLQQAQKIIATERGRLSRLSRADVQRLLS